MGVRDVLTTHPQIRRRRERALERFSVKANGPQGYAERKEEERQALIRKLGQRKQGSAA